MGLHLDLGHLGWPGHPVPGHGHLGTQQRPGLLPTQHQLIMFSKEHAKESSGEYGKKKRVIFSLYNYTVFTF